MGINKKNHVKHAKNSMHENLKSIKLAFSMLIVGLFIIIPILVSQISTKKTLETRSSANETNTNVVTGPMQSWIVSPNGSEILYGNTEIQFFAKDAANPTAKFSFTVDLFKGSEFSKNLFSLGINQQIADREGIRSKFFDFTGVAEGSDYKLKLTTTNENGTTTIQDYSDNFFTISADTSKPLFKSLPPKTTLSVGQKFEYDIKVVDTKGYKLSAPALPAWLTLSGAKLSGTANAEGVFSVILLATNDLGRQSSQIFSINVTKSATPTKVSTTNSPTPKPTGGKTGEDPSDTTIPAVITIKLPTGDKITKLDSKIESQLPADLKQKLKKATVEISRDGKNWEKVYEGESLSFNLDTSKYEGGEYYLRFTYDFNDGTREVKSYGPVSIIKQNTDSTVLDVNIKELKPISGVKITDRKPIISAVFEKPAGTNIDLKSFKLELDGKDLTTDQNTKPSPFSFTYVPGQELTVGKHTVKVQIGLENAKPVTQEWSFEIIDTAAKTVAKTETKGLFTKNRIIIAVIIGIIILIFILSMWAIALSKKEENYYRTETQVVETSPLRESGPENL
jgi:hypothetical protein